MPNLPISGFPAATLPLGATDAIPVVQGGVSKQAPVSALAGGLVLLASSVGSGAASVNFATRNAVGQSGAIFQSDFDDYLIEVINCNLVASGSDLGLRVGTGGGPTYDSGANYHGTNWQTNAAGASGAGGGVNATSIQMFVSASNAGTSGISGTAQIFAPQDTTFFKRFLVRTTGLQSTGNYAQLHGGGSYNSATALTAVQLVSLPTGTIAATGVFRMYGLLK